MDSLKSFFIVLCTTLVASSILKSLVSSNKLKKIFKTTVTSLVILSVITQASGFKNISTNLDLNDYVSEKKYDAKLKGEIEENICNNLKPIISKELLKLNIECDFELNCTISAENKKIEIKNVNIEITSPNIIDIEKIKNEIANNTGLNISVYQIEKE